jgi:hypothetical protein
VATVGGLTALVDRSISAANAIGKTADTIGVGVEALQELRFAAKASGVEQQTLDMALQRFTRRAAEAAEGTGEAKDALTLGFTTFICADQRARAQTRRAAPRPRSDPGADRVSRRAAGYRDTGPSFSARSRRHRRRAGSGQEPGADRA